MKGKYSIQKTLKYGSKGEIYLVKDQNNEQQYYCLKEQNRFRKVEKEFLNDRKNNSPQNPILLNIIEIHDSELEKYVVMEYCDGGDVARQLKEAKEQNKEINYSDIWKVILDVGKQLEVFHHLGYIYQDINPSNIVEKRIKREHGIEKAYKLCDFQSLEKGSNEKMISDDQQKYLVMKGYSAPEIILEQNTSFSSDIFSFGLLIFELVSKTQLFSGVNLQTVRKKFRDYKQNKAEIYQKIEETIQEGLAEVLKNMLDPEPKNRPEIKAVNQILSQYQLQSGYSKTEKKFDPYSTLTKSMNQIQTKETQIQEISQTNKQSFKNGIQSQRSVSTQTINTYNIENHKGNTQLYCDTLKEQIKLLKLLFQDRLEIPNNSSNQDWERYNLVTSEIDKLSKQLKLVQKTITELEK